MRLSSFISFLVCFTLLLQNAMALGLASYSMEKAHRIAGNDVELICTGKTMRYISLSQTDALGEFVFINPDVLNAPAEHVDCTNGVLADIPQTDDVYKSSIASLPLVRYRALVQRIAQRPYTLFPFTVPLGRAPPHA